MMEKRGYSRRCMRYRDVSGPNGSSQFRNRCSTHPTPVWTPTTAQNSSINSRWTSFFHTPTSLTVTAPCRRQCAVVVPNVIQKSRPALIAVRVLTVVDFTSRIWITYRSHPTPPGTRQLPSLSANRPRPPQPLQGLNLGLLQSSCKTILWPGGKKVCTSEVVFCE